MKLTALMPVRNEEWCLGLSARAALLWCDELMILNHASTDDTEAIVFDLLGEYPGRIIYERVEGEWLEMQHRQLMLETARERGATHIAIVDADEVLTGNLLKWAKNVFAFIAPREVPANHILHLPLYNLRGGLHKYHANGIWGNNRWLSTAFRDDARLHWGGDTFHAREPKGIELRGYRPIGQGEGGTMHLWGASERRLRAKSALYKLTERLRWPDRPVAEIERMYNWAIKGETGSNYGTPETWTYRDVPAEWWAPYMHLTQYLDVDAEPWQEAECKRLVAEHGRDKFAGLDLFGVV